MRKTERFPAPSNNEETDIRRVQIKYHFMFSHPVVLRQENRGKEGIYLLMRRSTDRPHRPSVFPLGRVAARLC